MLKQLFTDSDMNNCFIISALRWIILSAYWLYVVILYMLKQLFTDNEVNAIDD